MDKKKTKQPAAGHMRVTDPDTGGLTVAGRILVLAALSGGQVDRDVFADVSGPVYMKTLSKRMKDKRCGELLFGRNPRTWHIKRMGCESVEPLVPDVMDLLERNLLSTQFPERKSDISRTLWCAWKAGAELLPAAKPPLMDENGFLNTDPGFYVYAPREIWNGSLHDVPATRCAGLLMKDGNPYMLYHAGGRNIRFPKRRETNACTRLSMAAGASRKPVRAVIGSYSLLPQFMHNTEIAPGLEQGSHACDLITAGGFAGTGDLWFIPCADKVRNSRDEFRHPVGAYRVEYPLGGFDEAALHLRFLVSPGAADALVSYVRDNAGAECVSLLPLRLSTLSRMAAATAERPLAAVCTSRQQEELERTGLFPHVSFNPVKDEMLPALLK